MSENKLVDNLTTVCSDVESDDSSESFNSQEDELLNLARHGKEDALLQFLLTNDERDQNQKLDISCKGNQKCNRGWTALHLAAYFGQTSAVRLLLEFGARVDDLNTSCESPLHLAAYTGREAIVGLLLQYGAQTNLINSQGQTPRDVTKNQHILDMIDAANSSESLRIHSEFLQAAVSGYTEKLSRMLNDEKTNIDVQDSFGNTALHMAAMRGHGAASVILLQHGIDSSLRNQAGQTAFDVAANQKIKQVLGVQSIRALHTQPKHFQGILLKKSRFVGFKPMWVVLDRGVLSYFLNRGDASTGSRRKGMKYLDGARVLNSKDKPEEIRLEYSDGSRHTLQLAEPGNNSPVILQKWLFALQEHIAYNTYYIHQGEETDQTAKDMVSLGTMQETLQNAQAHKGHLEKQVEILQESIVALSKQISQDSNGGPSRMVTAADLRTLTSQSSDILKSSQDMLQALGHCMVLLTQQEELRELQLKEEQDRCRLLQDSLHALATEHHELEKSITRRHSFLSMDDEEFFDCNGDSMEHRSSLAIGDCLTEKNSQDSSNDNDKQNSEATPSYGRTRLPVPMFSRSEFSFWSILKQCVGKELSKITMPVVFNEPLSFIQRLAEYMEYAPLIEKAANCDNPVERMELITAFAISALSSNWERIGKPFNPLLGETYELDRPDLGFRFMGEQVSHHPPITAICAEGQAYAMHGSVQPKLKFWGKTVEITPKGHISLELKRYNETYSWQNVNCCVHNVIVGTLWVEHYGTMEITCNTSEMKSVINFKQSGWFAKDLHHVDGFVYNGKKKERAIYGSWVAGIYSCSPNEYEKFMNDSEAQSKFRAKEKKDKDHPRLSILSYNYQLAGQKILWLVNPRSPESADYYHFSMFAMTLNEMLPGMQQALPPTDSRFRPDIRNMEEGKIDQSAEEKNRVEEKQREARKERKKKSKDWHPRWFTLKKIGGREDWVFNPVYWDRNWNECADIF
ncbi:unnamed protein product [Lymnaea stagnalis]|uniref:Oxysterol-binding protein n=1 Tax=Lymnaea stagnalis TaxID=6523 RepID=A0AAV2HSP6_LYMST